MSGLYLLVLVAVWVGLSTLLWSAWRRWRISQKGSRRMRDALALVIALLWCGASFWYAGGQKIYYDMEVSRLCAKDGGVKVYETVKLPAEKFDRWGMVNFFRRMQKENALGPEYFYKFETTYYQRGNPDLFRMHTRVVRRSDGKLLGESVFYKRGGGDLPGPWHGSSFMCPELSVANDVLRQVFIKE